MEDGVVDENTKPKIVKDCDKAGCIKKCYARFFWKERYILLRNNQLLVYDNKESEKCIETIELGKYEKCQELRGVLKKKPRMILVRALGNKVSDIKLQTHSVEEREDWIKALNEGIKKARNSVFDEVKIDASCALEHVTRGRAKVNHPRRPPTRYALKGATTSGTDQSQGKEHVADSTDNEENTAPSDVADSPQKKTIIKPPMPPSKVSVLSETDVESQLKDMNEDITATDESEKTAVADSEEVCASEDTEAEKEEVAISGSNECLSQVSTEVDGKPPTPPPKILSPRLKINEDLVDASDEDAESTNTDDDLNVLVTESIKDHVEDGQKIMTKSSRPTSADISLIQKVNTVAAETSKSDLYPEGHLKKSVCKSLEDVSQDSSKKVSKSPVPPPKALKATLNVVLPKDGKSNCEEENVSSKVESSPTPACKILPIKVKANANVLHSSENNPPPDKQDVENLNFSLNHSKENLKEIKSDGIRKTKIAPPKVLKEKNSACLSKPKCSSLGDLTESNRESQKEMLMSPGLQKEEFFDKVQIKVCIELKEAEELLQTNPAPACTDVESKHVTENENALQLSAKQYLNEAVEKLKQASQVLQEVKDLKELCTEVSQNDEQNKKSMQSTYRRSMP